MTHLSLGRGLGHGKKCGVIILTLSHIHATTASYLIEEINMDKTEVIGALAIIAVAVVTAVMDHACECDG